MCTTLLSIFILNQEYLEMRVIEIVIYIILELFPINKSKSYLFFYLKDLEKMFI